MFDKIADTIVEVADFIGGYPLFFLLIGGGLYMFVRSGMVSLRRLPAALNALRQRGASGQGQISSAQALASAVAATIGLGNIAGVAIALVMGGPGAIFWMWVSAVVGMSTKFHEGVLAIMYRGKSDDGRNVGGPMYIIEHGMGPKWRPLAVFFAIAGLFGTLCIMNANQLTEASMAVFTTPEWVSANEFLTGFGQAIHLSPDGALKLIIGFAIALIVALVVLRGITRIAKVASVLVPFMVCLYFLMVVYIIATHMSQVPGVFISIFTEAFSLQAGLGALVGIAIIGARRAAVVNDAGIGTASLMHGQSRNNEPVREGLVAMLGPSIDSGLVCTLTAFAIMLMVPPSDLDLLRTSHDLKGLQVAMNAFSSAIPYGQYLLMLVVACFAFSSMFSYSFYGTRCAAYLFGEKRARYYTWGFIATLVIFAVIPLKAAVGLCDIFYALMAIPTMIALIALSGKVRQATKDYFSRRKSEK